MVMVRLAECEPKAKHSQYKEEQDGTDNLVALPSDLPEPPLTAFIEIDDSRHRGLPSTRNRDSRCSLSRLHQEVSGRSLVRSGSQPQP
jgi:hypothetical protein